MTVQQLFRRIKQPALPHFLRRNSPLSHTWGFDRGTPVDRHYIERFLDRYRQDIRGRTLEVAELEYTKRFGSAVTHPDVVDIDTSNKEATLIADLSITDQVPESTFDCFIFTQTLQFIYDFKAAVENSYRLLRPGGVILATVPSVSRIGPEDTHDFWRFTAPSCHRLFASSFGTDNTTVKSYGNLLTCVAFLEGLAYQELSPKQLDPIDESFPLIVTVRAVKVK